MKQLEQLTHDHEDYQRLTCLVVGSLSRDQVVLFSSWIIKLASNHNIQNINTQFPLSIHPSDWRIESAKEWNRERVKETRLNKTW